ncbi:MAG: bacteriohemerythrin [Caldicoprobacterales bacterium]|jgi:hemerythrin|nr:hemerythrin family protein [Clostridiales bacterium]
MYFEWKNAYELGVEEVDKQHNKLFRIGRNLSVLIQTTDILTNFNEIKQILGELKSYTIEHFSREEQFMRDKGYPDLASHIMEHDFLRKKLLKIDRLGHPNHETIVKLVSFVSDWISRHILISDMKIRNYLLREKD